MENSHSLQVVSHFVETRSNPNKFTVYFNDLEVEVDNELHVTQFNPRWILKSSKDKYEKLIKNGTIVKMNTTPID